MTSPDFGTGIQENVSAALLVFHSYLVFYSFCVGVIGVAENDRMVLDLLRPTESPASADYRPLRPIAEHAKPIAAVAGVLSFCVGVVGVAEHDRLVHDLLRPTESPVSADYRPSRPIAHNYKKWDTLRSF